MTEQKNSPVLRFPGFDSNWSKKRLKKIADINPKSKQNRPEQFNYIDLESVKQGRIINISKVSKDNAPSRAQRIAQKQDIFFQTVRPYQQNNFIYNFDVDDVVVSTGYAQFRTINHKYYIFTLLHTYRFLVNVLLNCTGSNYPAINSTDLSNIEVYITENKLEQEKIGNFFSKLDCQIELEEKKLELLEQQKRGYMQKIFSQDLRFKDENGNDYPKWVTQKIKELGKVYTGNTPSKKQSAYWNSNNYIWVTPTDINNKKNVKNSEYMLSDEGFKKARQLPKNTLLITCIASIGKNAILREEGSCNQQINALVPNNDKNVDFLYYAFEKVSKYMKRIAGKTATQIVNKSTFENISIEVPNIEEQLKIGRFLNSFDKLIEKQVSKIEILKQRKQGLLQKMFV